MRSNLLAASLICGVCLFASAATPPQKSAPAPVPDVAEQRAASIRLMRESIARQMAAVRAQASRAKLTITEPLPENLAEADCNPIPDAEVAPMIAVAATESRLDPELLRAVIHQESAFRPCAVSTKGALGLMQLMPDTAAELGATDPLDPRQNVRCGAQYLRHMLDLFSGDPALALAAYNAGPAKVKVGTAPEIPETQDYVARILEEWKSTLSTSLTDGGK